MSKKLKIEITQDPSDAAFITPDGYLVKWRGAHGDNAHIMLGHEGSLPEFGGKHYQNDLDRVMSEYGLIRLRPESRNGTKIDELNIETRSKPTSEQIDALYSYYPDANCEVDTEYQEDDVPHYMEYNQAIVNVLKRSR